MAVFNEPTKWQTSLVNSGDANVIPQSTPVGTGEASFDDGFPQITQIPIGAGGIAPDRKDFNGLFKILGDWIFFNQNGGVSTYSENFDYVAGRVVSYNDNIYKCIQANGVSSTVVTPDSDTAYWQRIDNFVRSVNGVDADASGNVTVTTSLNVDYTAGVNVGSIYTSSNEFTAPCDGILAILLVTDAINYIYINGSKTSYCNIDGCPNGGVGSTMTIFLKKGDTVYTDSPYQDQSAHQHSQIFYPFK